MPISSYHETQWSITSGEWLGESTMKPNCTDMTGKLYGGSQTSMMI